MLVNIIQSFDTPGRRWLSGENPDVDPTIAAEWIRDGKATADLFAQDTYPAIVGDGGPYYAIVDRTWAALLLLNPADFRGRACRVTDLNNAWFESNGSRWKPVGGRAVIGTLDSDWTGVAGTAEQIAYQRTIPAGLIRNGDALMVMGGFGKSGTAETTTIQIRIGAAGTTADTPILSTAPLVTTNISHGMLLEFRRQSATSVQRGLSGATQNPLGASTAARGAAVALASSLDSVNQILSLTMTQTGAVEVPSAWGFRVELISSGA